MLDLLLVSVINIQAKVSKYSLIHYIPQVSPLPWFLHSFNKDLLRISTAPGTHPGAAETAVNETMYRTSGVDNPWEGTAQQNGGRTWGGVSCDEVTRSSHNEGGSEQRTWRTRGGHREEEHSQRFQDGLDVLKREEVERGQCSCAGRSGAETEEVQWRNWAAASQVTESLAGQDQNLDQNLPYVGASNGMPRHGMCEIRGPSAVAAMGTTGVGGGGEWRQRGRRGDSSFPGILWPGKSF